MKPLGPHDPAPPGDTAPDSMETILLTSPKSPVSICVKSKRLRAGEIIGVLSEDDSEDEDLRGYGSMTFWNGDLYEGFIVGSKMSGVGTLWHGDGSVYKGHFDDGVKCGWGMTVWKDGNKHVGMYMRDLPNGHGTLKARSGQVTVGSWVDGKLRRLSVGEEHAL